MFSDPQSITVNAVAQSMPRIESNGLKTIYKKADRSYTLTVSHQLSKGRVRSMVRVDKRAVVTNPLDSSNDYDTLAVYFVIDRPEEGFSSTEIDHVRAALSAWLDTTATGKLVGMES